MGKTTFGHGPSLRAVGPGRPFPGQENNAELRNYRRVQARPRTRPRALLCAWEGAGSTADLAHSPGGADKIDPPDGMARPLGRNFAGDGVGQLIVAGASAQQLA